MKRKLFAGNSNINLATKISNILNQTLEPTEVGTFSDGEIRIELKNNVRGSDAFIIQSTCAPSNNNLMELLLLADALKRASAAKIIAIVPYIGYTRQDRRPGYQRVPISARVIADLMEVVKIDHVVTIDLHATQVQGFFSVPVDNLSPTRLYVQDINSHHNLSDIVVVSPDVGGVARARNIAKFLNNADLAIIDKRRPKANVAEIMHIIGDVENKTCVLVDDMLDTGGTICKAADILIERGGAKKVVAYCTHGILSGSARDNINNSKIAEIVVTDTVPVVISDTDPKIRQLSVANIIADTIDRIYMGHSVSEIVN